MKKIAFLLPLIILASCSQDFEYKQADADGQPGHLDNFISQSESVTSEIQSDSIDVARTVKLTSALKKYQEAFPERYNKVAAETNGWEIAKMLKRDKEFVSFAKEVGLNMNSVPFIERND